MVQGKIEVVSRAGTGVKIGEEWYNNNTGLFANLKKGMSVILTCEKDPKTGKFNKVVEVKVDESKPSAPAGRKPGFIDNSIGQAVGMSINNAIALCIAEVGHFDESYVRNTACAIYALAEELKANASEGDITKTNAAAASASAVETEEDPF